MSEWSSGYVSELEYSFGYYAELNPLNMEAAFINSGYVYPAIENACELGFGQGLSVNMHAASSNINWYGTDFIPAQASFAQQLARSSGARAHLFDDSFEEFARRQDLPDFDFIGLHGVWSWISDKNRQVLVDFFKAKLKVGGVVYLSYNTLPGWANFAPIRHLMTQHADVLGAQGEGVASRINESLKFADELLQLNPLYAATNPGVTDKLHSLQTQSRSYLAHEYFNKDWEPMHFSAVAESLGRAKLSYVCSAGIVEDMDQLHLSEEQSTFLNKIPDRLLRESARDFMTNKIFRRDYWVKGLRRMDSSERMEKLKAMSVTLQRQAGDIERTYKCAGHSMTLVPQIYDPIIASIEQHGTVSAGQIENDLCSQGISIGQIGQAIMLLSQRGDIRLAQQGERPANIEVQTTALNRALLQTIKGNNPVPWVVSPLLAGGVRVGPIEQLFLLAKMAGQTSVEGMAEFAWSLLIAKGEKLVLDGRTLETDGENIAKLREYAESFQGARGLFLERVMKG